MANMDHEGHGAHPPKGHDGHGERAHEARGGHGPEAHGKQGPEAHKGHDHGRMIADYKKRFWICLIVTVPILLLSEQIQMFLRLGDTLLFNGDKYVLFVLSSFVYFYGGLPFLKGIVQETRTRATGMMTLIAVAITTAYAYSVAVTFGLPGMVFYWELATLIDVMLLGHWIEMKSVLGASRALEELARLMPSDAHKVMPDGSVVDVPLSDLDAGDRVLVKPGEKVPADGSVVEGQTSIDESLLTGESNPVSKSPGSAVIGGSINAEGSITVEVRKTGKDSFLSQVIDLVREAQESKSRTQDLANRAAFWLTVLALGGGAVTLFVWTALAGQSLAFALERTVTVMVIACPHALGLAVPLVVAVSTALAAGQGLLIRNRAAFEAARKVNAIIFDKTGTLTQGKFGVTDVVNLSGGPGEAGAPSAVLSDEALLLYAASVEARSEHPIAKGVVASADRTMPVEGFRAIPGKGAEGVVDGRRVMVVSPGYLAQQGRPGAGAVENPEIDRLSAQGKTVVFVVIDDRPVGAIALADIIRPESREAIARLKEMGIKPIMLTGDNRAVAKWVADELGLEEYFAEVLPQDKSAKVKEVQAKGFIVAMTGDGVNDAPALAQADVGIAIGAGTDVALETADIILVRSNPLDAVSTVGLARATYSKMIQNLAWATGYNAIAIPLAAGVLYQYGVVLTPALGAAFMSVSTVIVAINSRFLRMP